MCKFVVLDAISVSGRASLQERAPAVALDHSRRRRPGPRQVPRVPQGLSLIHISEPTRLDVIS
eukprot:12654926-Prorocentrum_lima.AAC.1